MHFVPFPHRHRVLGEPEQKKHALQVLLLRAAVLPGPNGVEARPRLIELMPATAHTMPRLLFSNRRY